LTLSDGLIHRFIMSFVTHSAQLPFGTFFDGTFFGQFFDRTILYPATFDIQLA
jgi:hypothetical protein